MIPSYELRCPVHGRIKDLPATMRAIDQAETCPDTTNEVRCALPLFVAEADKYASRSESTVAPCGGNCSEDSRFVLATKRVGDETV
jgi:hypothetical protein